MARQYISYRRVSTKRQQKSGLGLEVICKDIEERKRQLVRNMEEHYICIDDGQGGKIAIKKR